MSTMSELHIRTQDELDYLAEVNYHNQQAMIDVAKPLPKALRPQPLWLLKFRGWFAQVLHSWAYKIDTCPF